MEGKMPRGKKRKSKTLATAFIVVAIVALVYYLLVKNGIVSADYSASLSNGQSKTFTGAGTVVLKCYGSLTSPSWFSVYGTANKGQETKIISSKYNTGNVRVTGTISGKNGSDITNVEPGKTYSFVGPKSITGSSNSGMSQCQYTFQGWGTLTISSRGQGKLSVTSSKAK